MLSHDHKSASNLDDEAFDYNDKVHMNNSQKSAHLSYGGAVILIYWELFHINHIMNLHINSGQICFVTLVTHQQIEVWKNNGE